MARMSPSASHLIVHRDSRMEALAAGLADALEVERPANPLVPQTVVVAHPGLGRWLLGEFAHRPRAGGHGIAANFDIIQPWQWLERAAALALPDHATGGDYRQERLRWHIHALVSELDAAPIRAFLTGEEGERRRFQLADRLAGVYAQYLVYRPNWIAAWEHGADAKDWQAVLWRKLRKRIVAPHRAQRQAELVLALAAGGDGERAPLHVFGVSHLPADILGALCAVSTQRPVHLWFPDPCREYWADLQSRRALIRCGEVAD